MSTLGLNQDDDDQQQQPRRRYAISLGTGLQIIASVLVGAAMFFALDKKQAVLENATNANTARILVLESKYERIAVLESKMDRVSEDVTEVRQDVKMLLRRP